MSTSRVKALAKLFLLLGLPVTLLAGLFGGGVYLGHSHRVGILRFEKEWLGMDVEVPSAGPWIDDLVAKSRDPKALKAAAEAPKTPQTPTETPETAPEVKPEETPKPSAPETPVGTTTPPETAPPSLLDPPLRPAMPLTLVLPEPIDGELQASRRAPLTLRIKALVDPGVAPDAFAYVQRILEWTAQILDPQLGVDLELTAIARWDGDPTTLCARPLEGADVILGISRRAFTDEDPRLTPSCAVVGVNARSRQAPHLRPLLFAFGRLVGATAIGDPGSEAWRKGSWMADVLADDAQPLYIDPESRKAMILGKAERPWARAPAGGGDPAEVEIDDEDATPEEE